MMAGAVYIVGTLVALCCAILLLRGYARGRQRLLLWSGLYLSRLATAAVSMLLLLYGLISEAE
jgi:hypothetical protein